MGFAIAAEAARRGAEVTLVAGPTAIEPPPVREVVRVRSAAEMHAGRDVARRRRWTSSSWRRRSPTTRRPSAAPQKVSKDGETLTLVLQRTPDILADLGRAAAGDGRRARCSSGSRPRPRTWSRERAAKREQQARRPHRRQRRVARRCRLRRRHQRGDDRRRRRRRGAAAAEQGAASPRRSSIASSSCSPADRPASHTARERVDGPMDRDQLAEHLRFAAELGVAGVSRDPAWRDARSRARPDGAEPSRPSTAAPSRASMRPSSVSRRAAADALAAITRRHRRLHALQAAHARAARRSCSASATRTPT